jgi:hypothetical protein
MIINYWAVLVCSILALVFEVLWYGPIFGKAWAKVVNMDAQTEEKRKEMRKGMWTPMFVTLLLTLFQVWVLAYYIAGWKEASGLENAFWIWAAFVMPTVAASAMWTADEKKVKWSRFLLQAGCQLVLFAAFGYILGTWK